MSEQEQRQNDEQSPEMARRDFLKIAWSAMGVAAVGGVSFVGLRYLGSRVIDSDFGKVLTAGKIEDFPPATVTAFNNGKFFLVRAEDGGFLALYHKCTHLDCVVLWDEEAGQFHCPCHGSRFALDGDVLNDPAPRPLVRFPVEFDDRDRVLVDTGTLIDRTVTTAEDFAYPPTQTVEEQSNL